MSLDNSPFADLAGLSRNGLGTHCSHFYEAADDLAEAVVPFLVAGIRNRERCLWVTCDPLPAAQAFDRLERAVPDLPRLMAQGQVEIVDHRDWYAANGAFQAQAVLDAWIRKEGEALARGWSGLRITGNTFWLDTPDDFTEFADYEAALHRVLEGRRIVCLCSYCLSRCSAATLLDVVRNHNVAVARRRGAWQVVESAEIAAARNELAERLARRDRLLNEIHHRVKNNLQIIQSLLTIKAKQFGGPAAASALQDTMTRIGSMALVHELLYEQDDGGAIDLASYLRRLIAILAQAYGCAGRITLRVEERRRGIPMLPLDIAIPFAIATAEAVTNAIKHAFPDGRCGQIRVVLDCEGDALQLRIVDDGVGLPSEGGRQERLGAGMSLVRGLVAQAGGRVDIISGLGCEMRFSLPVNGLMEVA